MKPQEGFMSRMRDAMAALQAQGPMAATRVIQEALHGQPQFDHKRPTSPVAQQWSTEDITDVSFMDVEPNVQRARPAEAPPRTGRFVAASCTNRAGTRNYKVYIPSAYTGQALPLVVMLHGCKQNPDDFAAGTAMNHVAEEHDCFVVYPAQAQNANGSNCWNWFNPGDQKRDIGEPSMIADITREVIKQYNIDTKRCYVAGLSAGGAMAAILIQNYPEIYAAAGIHSGLPVGAADSIPSAFAAMKNPSATAPTPGTDVPVIVFHGDKDATVHPRNGKHVLDQSAGRDARQTETGSRQTRTNGSASVTVNKGKTVLGRAYTTTIKRDADGKIRSEYWVIHGAGHAWSGGTRQGSYTDPSGPNASKEMLRFFLEHTMG